MVMAYQAPTALIAGSRRSGALSNPATDVACAGNMSTTTRVALMTCSAT